MTLIRQGLYQQYCVGISPLDVSGKVELFGLDPDKLNAQYNLHKIYFNKSDYNYGAYDYNRDSIHIFYSSIETRELSHILNQMLNKRTRYKGQK